MHDTPPSSEFGRQLESLLGDQLGRLRRRYLIHGLGWLLAVLGAALIVYYVTDRLLDLPRGVRIIHSLLTAGLLVWTGNRFIGYPLRRPLSRDDIAVALERSYPELRERLVTAVQLRRELDQQQDRSSDLRNQSRAMIDSVITDASAAVRAIDLQRFLDARSTRNAWAAAAGLGLVVATGIGLDPTGAGVFAQRMFGADVAWPRLTTLIVELPNDTRDFQVRREGKQATVTVAAGADFPVLVRADGKVPREVFLMVSGGQGMPPRVAMAARGERMFRHVFRRARSPFSFYARGGDDPHGDLEVTLEIVEPPRVGEIRTTLEYPAYTGLEPRTGSGGAIEALVGTRVQLQLTATAAVRAGRLTFLESGAKVELVPRKVADDGGERTLWTAEFAVAQSDRYQIELVAPSGLENPHPGAYPVVATADHAPIGRILIPGDDQLDVVVPGGWIAVRATARDDFGLDHVHASLRIERQDKGAEVPLFEVSATAGGDGEEGANPSPAPVERLVATSLFEVDKLPIEGARAAVGDTIDIGLSIVDNRRPEALTTEVPVRRVHVVAPADLARRVSGHFRRIRETVERAITLQAERHQRLRTVRADLEGGKSARNLRGDLTVIQVGQTRIQSMALQLRRELMRSFNLHLFNRLDPSPHTDNVLALYRDHHRTRPVTQLDDTAYDPAFYAKVATARRTGSIGELSKTLDPILQMTTAAAEVAESSAPAASSSMTRALVEGEQKLPTHLRDTEARQAAILKSLEQLRALLDEWNELQDAVRQTRSLLDKQRDVEFRTRELLQGDGNPNKEKR